MNCVPNYCTHPFFMHHREEEEEEEEVVQVSVIFRPYSQHLQNRTLIHCTMLIIITGNAQEEEIF